MNSLPHFLELLAKSALVLTAAALLAASWWRASAAQRHTLWLAAFVALLLLPLSKLATPHWRLPGSPSAPAIFMTSAPAIAEATTDIIAAAAAPVPVRAWRWPEPTRLLTGVWLAGVAALIAYRLIGSVQIARLRRRSTPLDDTRVLALARTAAAELDLADRYEIRHATAARVPCTWGVRRPVILLPTAALHWNETRLLAALRHEFGHIARRDYLTRWLGYIICALYWPNPLVWLAARSLHKTQEQACDDLVLRAGTPAADYAALLFEAASASGQPVRHAVAMARPSTLEGRVLAIVDDTRNRRPSGRGTTVAGALVVIAALGISALAQVASDTPAPTTAAPAPKPQVLIEAKVLEIPADQSPAVTSGGPGAKTAEQAAALLRTLESAKGVDILSAPRVLTHSGQRAMIQIGSEEKMPAGSQPPTIFVGITLDLLPTLAAGVIQLQTSAEFVSRKAPATAGAQPVFHTRKTTTSVAIPDGQTVVIGGIAAEKPGREILIFLTASSPAKTATGGAPSASIITREYKISPDLAAAFEREMQGRPVREILFERGIPFGEGTTATYIKEGRRLIVRNTPEHFGAVEALVAAGIPPGTEAPKPGSDAPRTPIEVKANALIIPRLELREGTLREAVDFLVKKSRELDPEKKGIAITLAKELTVPTAGATLGGGAGLGFFPSEARITISLTNIPFAEALKYITSLASTKFQYTDTGVLIVPLVTGASGAQP